MLAPRSAGGDGGTERFQEHFTGQWRIERCETLGGAEEQRWRVVSAMADVSRRQARVLPSCPLWQRRSRPWYADLQSFETVGRHHDHITTIGRPAARLELPTV